MGIETSLDIIDTDDETLPLNFYGIKQSKKGKGKGKNGMGAMEF